MQEICPIADWIYSDINASCFEMTGSCSAAKQIEGLPLISSFIHLFIHSCIYKGRRLQQYYLPLYACSNSGSEGRLDMVLQDRKGGTTEEME